MIIQRSRYSSAQVWRYLDRLSQKTGVTHNFTVHRDRSGQLLLKKLTSVTTKSHFLENFVPDDGIRDICAAETVSANLENFDYSDNGRSTASPVTV